MRAAASAADETRVTGADIGDAGRLALAALHAENRACAARLRACHELYRACEIEHDAAFVAALCGEEDCVGDCAYGRKDDDDNRSRASSPADSDPPDHTVLDPFSVACAELVAAYGVHHHRASAMLTLAKDLVLRFPAVLEAMESGRLDERTASMLANQMRTVDNLHRDAVHRAVVDWLMAAIDSGRRPGRHAILEATDRIIGEHDPQGVLLRRAEALRQRKVRLRRGVDGMADIHAHLSAPEAQAVHLALQDAARRALELEKQERVAAARNDGSERVVRSLDELRADALVDAILGPAAPLPVGPLLPVELALPGPGFPIGGSRFRGPAPAPTPGPTPGPAPGPTAGAAPAAGPASTAGQTPAGPPTPAVPGARIRPTITVLMPREPGALPEVFLPRSGQASIESLIALLSRSAGATIEVPDTAPGAADTARGARRYRISAELARRIRLRDGTCRHPGCSVSAEDCDIDHARPFDHTDPGRGGPTAEANLMCLCRQHHRFKTFHDWRYRLSADGTLTITTSTGHTVSTEPAGPLAQWRRRAAEAEANSGSEGTERTEETAEGPGAKGPGPAEAADAADTAEARGVRAAGPGSARSPGPHPDAAHKPWLDPTPRRTNWYRRILRLESEREANSAPPDVRRGEPRDRQRPRPEDEPPPF